MSLPLPLHAYIKTNGGTKHPNVITDSCLQRKKKRKKKGGADVKEPAKHVGGRRIISIEKDKKRKEASSLRCCSC